MQKKLAYRKKMGDSDKLETRQWVVGHCSPFA